MFWKMIEFSETFKWNFFFLNSSIMSSFFSIIRKKENQGSVFSKWDGLSEQIKVQS